MPHTGLSFKSMDAVLSGKANIPEESFPWQHIMAGEPYIPPLSLLVDNWINYTSADHLDGNM